MTTAAVLLAAGAGSRFAGPTHKLLAPWGATTVFGAALTAILSTSTDDEPPFAEVIVVVGAVDASALAVPDGVTVVVNDRWSEGIATSLTTGIEAAASAGHHSVVVGLADQPAVTAAAWRAVAAASGATPIVAARSQGIRRPPVRLDASVWPLLPVDGDEGARVLWLARPELVSDVEVAGSGRDVDTTDHLLSRDDVSYVSDCLGRAPRARFTIAARDEAGRPTVIENPPFLDDGTPMPTRYWLVDPALNRSIGRLESEGGVDAAEAEIGLDRLAEVHAAHAAARDALVDPDHAGPRPSGGVGGTRVGVKCLHTHYAAFLAGEDDPVGAWADRRLVTPDPTQERP